MSNPFELFLTSPDAVNDFDSAALVQAMLDFEAALAHASAEVGLIPKPAAIAIAGICRAQLLDVDAIVAASGRAGSLAIPLVKSLTEAVALFDPEAAGYVHRGATSQDVIDTAMALCTRRYLDAIDADLERLLAELEGRARAHRDTPLLARTLMQAAQVTSFGLKCANWFAPLARSRWALRELAPHALCLQLGGAVGTRATLGEHGHRIAELMAARLNLSNPASAWHTARDRWLRLGSELAITCGSMGKVARDLSLMAQSEIAEIAEASGDGRGGSSAMPHKRNPVGAMSVLAAAQRTPHRLAAMISVMTQEHERGLGNWQAELAEWAGLCISVRSATRTLADTLQSLQCFPERMLENIEAQRGMVFAEGAAAVMARCIGKQAAHQLVETAARNALAEDGQLHGAIDALLTAESKRFESLDRAALNAAFSINAAATHAGSGIDAIFSETTSLNPSPKQS
ncbi:MAG: 3-carboxy-cis,cis-muconate cycloisomerase [Burkholderiales bacterium]|nr:MAG: 3-carboxy-cis,cis-muconate cycloisomerase [Burkholderiales bacterium]